MQRPEQVGGHNHSGPLTANWGGEVLNVPNAITFGRLCAVPVAVWFVLQGRMGWALVLFVLAAGLPFIDLEVRGRVLQTSLLSGPVQWWLARPIHIRPMLLGKANTVLQILLVGVVLLLESQGLHAPALLAGLVAGAALATVISGVLYVRGAMGRKG